MEARRAPVALIGPADFRRQAEECLVGHGGHGIVTLAGAAVTLDPAGPRAGVTVFDSAGSLAAAYASRAEGPDLLPEAERAARRARATRLTLRLSAAAAVLLAVAAAADFWDARRELDAVLARREAIRPAASEMMERRKGLLARQDRIAALAALGATAPRWSEVIGELADHLPRDAHLTAFGARGDSVALEGVADRAAGVFEGVQAAPSVLGVRAEAPIRREQVGAGKPVERFRLSARLAGRGKSAEGDSQGGER